MKTLVNVELWDTTDDGDEVSEKYMLEVDIDWENSRPQSFESDATQGWFSLDVVNWFGINPKSEIGKRLQKEVWELDWDKIIAEINFV